LDDYTLTRKGSIYNRTNTLLSGADNLTTMVAVYRFKIDDLTKDYILHLKYFKIQGNPGSLRSYIITNPGTLNDVSTNQANVWNEIINTNVNSITTPITKEDFEIIINKSYFSKATDDYLTIALRATNETLGNYYLLGDYNSYKPYLTIKD